MVPGVDVLRIEAEADDGTVVVRLAGEIDLADADGLAAALRDAVSRAGSGVVVDLRAVTFAGSTALRLLLDAEAAAGDAGVRLTCVWGTGPAHRLLRLTGADRLLGPDDPEG